MSEPIAHITISGETIEKLEDYLEKWYNEIFIGVFNEIVEAGIRECEHRRMLEQEQIKTSPFFGEYELEELNDSRLIRLHPRRKDNE